MRLPWLLSRTFSYQRLRIRALRPFQTVTVASLEVIPAPRLQTDRDLLKVMLYMDLTSSFWIEVDVEHDFEKVSISLNPRRFIAIHHDLAASSDFLIVGPGKTGIHDPDEVGKVI